MSFDPHIDIDELDEPAPAARPAATATDPPEPDWISGEPAGLLSMGDTFYKLLHQMHAWQERLKPSGLPGFMPSRVNRHLRSAQREFLLAWRGLIDLALERIEQQEKAEAAQAKPHEPPV